MDLSPIHRQPAGVAKYCKTNEDKSHYSIVRPSVGPAFPTSFPRQAETRKQPRPKHPHAKSGERKRRYIAQGNLETARSMARRVCVITLACSGFLATLLLSLSGVIPRVFTSDPEVLRRLYRLLPLLALQQPLVAMTLVAEGLLVGAGQVFPAECTSQSANGRKIISCSSPS